MTTMEDFILGQLEQPVKLANGSLAMKEDGTPMTKEEAIAMTIMNKAMKGDIQAVEYIRRLQVERKAENRKNTLPDAE